ncbi:MAG: class I SAM-dependent methyltransferase [Polyangiales bacterium]
MKQATRDRLNAINREFYRRNASEFSRTRARPWPGMARVVAAVGSSEPSVLDLGCGNGRFVLALSERFGNGFEYVGVDFSSELLALAVAAHARPGARFEQRDFVTHAPEESLPTGRHDLVALLGVLHHVPGEDTRRALLEAAASRVAASGMLAITLWRFDRSPRFAGRRLAHSQYVSLGLDPNELEPGDELLRFGASSETLRYCHFVDDAELARLLASLTVELVSRFSSDGEGGAQNEYLLLRGR